MYIVKKEFENQGTNYLLKLNRTDHKLEVYQKADNSVLNEHYSIRPDFDASGYTMYEKLKSIDCIFGGEKSPTPMGIFKIENKSVEEYLSGYYPKRGQVKFFGYLEIFEDYFIHSDLYDAEVTRESMKDHEPISGNDTFTSGCIRIAQSELEWLIENIEPGTTVIM